MKFFGRFKVRTGRIIIVCMLMALGLIEAYGHSRFLISHMSQQGDRFDITVVPIERWRWIPEGRGRWDSSGGIRMYSFGFIRVVRSFGIL